MSLDVRNLLAGLSADKSLSGSALAAHHGVTRAAVWKQIQALRALGAPIDAAAGTGYRLRWPLELLDCASIRAQLPREQRERLAALDVHWQLDSTNSELARRAAEDTRDLRICLAETQTSGRGRRGRHWQSPLAGNLYLSLLKRFSCGMGALAGLSLAVGVAAVRALGAAGIEGVGLKWPNDLLADGRKLGGILVELGGEFLGPCHAIIGIGVNLRLAPEQVSDQPITDLVTLNGGNAPARNALAAGLITQMIAALDEFEGSGFAAFQSDYRRFDLLIGKALTVIDARGSHEGIGAGVDARGALLVRHAAGVVAYDSAEVSVRGA
jgi:BirA family transcriptional regulator, biotin operon repressor / biotin---[acetyl-CoA-carboxylase] ligase